MGWVERRGGRYLARWRVPGSTTPVSVTCRSKEEAKRVITQAAADLSRGLYIDPRGGRATLTDWALLWEEGRSGIKPSARAADRSRLRNHLLPHLGDHELADITPLTVRRWVATLEPRLAPKTIRHCHGLLYTIMADAVREGLLARNPCAGTSLPEVPHAEMRFLTPPELDRLIAAVPTHYRPLIVTFAGTGLRWGEAAGLLARRVDLLAGRLEVVETLHEVDGRLAVGTPKTRAARRMVTLPEPVVDALVPLLAASDGRDPVFTTERGALLRRHNFGRRIWRPAVEAAGLPDGLRVHDLRHTHAAQLISAGVPLTAVSRRLGHKSITVTSDIYGHLMPEVDQAVLSAAERLFQPPAGTGCPPICPPDDVRGPTPLRGQGL